MTIRLARALSIARSAGHVLQRHLGRLTGFDEKSAIDLVTVADRESEALIARELGAAFPDDALLLEEGDGKQGAQARRDTISGSRFTWCIDPLDGTTNFVHAYPQFAISAGLLFHGVPVLGVVHAPALGETYAGGQGVPATLNGQPISVSRVERIAHALLSTGFPYDRRERIDALLAIVREVILSAHDIRRAGSAALDLCFVAAGRTDGFFEQGLSPWDLAAGQAIVEAAGGRVTDYGRGPHDLFGGEILATNGKVHDALAALIDRARIDR